MPKQNTVQNVVVPVLEADTGYAYRFQGVVGDRVQAAVEGWVLPAPDANPAMLDMFRDRDRSPNRELVPWAGEFVGKYLIGAQQLLRLTGDERLRELIHSVVEELLSYQGDDGYLGPFSAKDRLVRKWDVWGHYHAMLGMMDYSEWTGDSRAVEACLRISHLLHEFFIKGDRRMITPEDADGEKNHAVIHALVRLYRLTGDEAAHELIDWIMKEWDEPPAGRYVTSALEGSPVSAFAAHRWESLHDHQGILEAYLLTGNDKLRQAFEHIWRSCRDGDRHNTGGFTAGEECTGNPYQYGAIETCCTVAWIALSVDMLRLTGDSRIADEIELSTLNGIIGGQNPSGRWWTYDTPMDGIKKASAHDIVFQSRAGSPEFNCCSANAPRGIGMIADWGVMTSSRGLVLNYFGESEITAKTPSGTDITIVQKTEYPVEPSVEIVVHTDAKEEFELALRIPEWSRTTVVKLNDDPEETPQCGRYHRITRTWKRGDRISIVFDFRPHVWIGEKDCAGKTAIYRGPVLLAFDPRFNDMDPDEIPPVDMGRLTFEDTVWSGRRPPWILVSVPAADGREMVLCDFANAGMTGTHYRSWLPAENVDKIRDVKSDVPWV